MVESSEISELSIRENIRTHNVCLCGLVEDKKNLVQIDPLVRRLSLVVEENKLTSRSQLFYSKNGLIVYLSLLIPGRRFNINDLDNWIGFRGNSHLEVANNFEFMSFPSSIEDISYHVRGWVERIDERRMQLSDLF